MTSIYLTIDTEFSAKWLQRYGEKSLDSNFDASISGRVSDGEAGIFYQMDVFDAHGLKAVFFVDPMPALVWGTDAIKRIVHPIMERGHDIQLHIHTEWLELAGERNPLGGRTGRNIKDFNLDEQTTLISIGAEFLHRAGAHYPIAFRAGNYGANDNTLKALNANGIRYDTSHCPALVNSGDCAISLGANDLDPVNLYGVLEVPVGSIAARNGDQRHAQITAMSSPEVVAAIHHARDTGREQFTLVSHSFELLSRDRMKINRIVRSQFETICEKIAESKGLTTATYSENPPSFVRAPTPSGLLPHDMLRTTRRMFEQAVSNALYGAK